MNTDLKILVEANLRSFFIVERICIAVKQQEASKVASLWRELEDLRDTVDEIEPPPQEVLGEMKYLMGTVESDVKEWIRDCSPPKGDEDA